MVISSYSSISTYEIDLGLQQILSFGASESALLITTGKGSNHAELQSAYLIINTGNTQYQPTVVPIHTGNMITIKAGVGGGGSKITITNTSDTSSVLMHVISLS